MHLLLRFSTYILNSVYVLSTSAAHSGCNDEKPNSALPVRQDDLHLAFCVRPRRRRPRIETTSEGKPYNRWLAVDFGPSRYLLSNGGLRIPCHTSSKVSEASSRYANSGPGPVVCNFVLPRVRQYVAGTTRSCAVIPSWLCNFKVHGERINGSAASISAS